MEDILEMENEILSVSIPYRDSTAMQLAFAHIKKTDIELYRKLLLYEGTESGVLE